MPLTDKLSLRRTLSSLLLTLILAPVAFAHHGWSWTEEGNFQLIGIITEARLGNPHGRLTVQAEEEQWLVEVGQPWRNERAGLTDQMLSPDTEITIIGHRSSDPNEKRMKAERVFIDGQEYVLYPDRN